MTHFPDYFQGNIYTVQSFFTLMPETVFGFPGSMILQLNFEYFIPANVEGCEDYMVSVWVSEQGKATRYFIFQYMVPVSDNPEVKIVEKLNSDAINSEFGDRMCYFLSRYHNEVKKPKSNNKKRKKK